MGRVEQLSCWFCGSRDGQLTYDVAFNTHVHYSCVTNALREDAAHPVALHMLKLFE